MIMSTLITLHIGIGLAICDFVVFKTSCINRGLEGEMLWPNVESKNAISVHLTKIFQVPLTS